MESESESVPPEEPSVQKNPVKSAESRALVGDGNDPAISRREPSITSKMNSYFANQQGRSLGRNTLSLFTRKTGSDKPNGAEVEALPRKKRQEVEIEEETLKDVMDKLKVIKSTAQVVTSITVHSIRRRQRARRECAVQEERFNDAIGEYERVRTDMYDANFASKVKQAEMELDRAEVRMKNAQATRQAYEFNDDGARALAKALKRNKDLRVLRLFKNDIGPLGIKSLAAILAKSNSLVELNLSSNPLGEKGGHLLHEGLRRNKHLQRLDVHSCGLEPPGVGPLCKSVQSHPTLQWLNLRNNDLMPKGAHLVADSIIRQNTVLKEINLATNYFGVEGIECIASALDENKTLLHVDLGFNDCRGALRTQEHLNIMLKLRRERIKGIWPHWEYS